MFTYAYACLWLLFMNVYCITVFSSRDIRQAELHADASSLASEGAPPGRSGVSLQRFPSMGVAQNGLSLMEHPIKCG